MHENTESVIEHPCNMIDFQDRLYHFNILIRLRSDSSTKLTRIHANGFMGSKFRSPLIIAPSVRLRT
ncbi:predicted protein [Botrytis cinerea T4]|uniref:Uncharacterized protein n=1 Tax=Botryotinia fuckeliana (strain T4) TaxID=999810 RepID=G2YZ02_BOTF4|nr:predicted protein [Botrytis cinerea T4]